MLRGMICKQVRFLDTPLDVEKSWAWFANKAVFSISSKYQGIEFLKTDGQVCFWNTWLLGILNSQVPRYFWAKIAMYIVVKRVLKILRGPFSMESAYQSSPSELAGFAHPFSQFMYTIIANGWFGSCTHYGWNSIQNTLIWWFQEQYGCFKFQHLFS